MHATSRLPRMSVVVVCYNMRREARRTLFSLSPHYQGMAPGSYEVIVIDNGSTEPLEPELIADLPDGFRYEYIETTSASPVGALNRGVELAHAEIVGLCIDGARILSPGILRSTTRAFKAFESPAVVTLGWHLGPDVQMRSVPAGYNQDVEDELLASVDWRNEPAELFRISSLAASASRGWFGDIAESNCVFLEREAYREIGGYDERFDAPGGGLANHDFLARVIERRGDQFVVLLGEGTFHQVHGGAATSDASYFSTWHRQYEDIRGVPYTRPEVDPHYFGRFPPEARRFILPPSGPANAPD